jgi:phage gpG-like protein
MPSGFEAFIDDGGTPQIVGDLLIESGDAAVLGMEKVMELIFYDMLVGNLAQITGEGHRGGGSYAQLKENTIKKKGSAEILFTMGARPKYSTLGNDTLVNSVTQPDAEYQIKHVTNDQVILGTDRPYAGAHQYGSSARKIPARPFLSIIPSDRARWNRWIAERLMEPLKEK